MSHAVIASVRNSIDTKDEFMIMGSIMMKGPLIGNIIMILVS